jgi:hypothetical protein
MSGWNRFRHWSTRVMIRPAVCAFSHLHIWQRLFGTTTFSRAVWGEGVQVRNCLVVISTARMCQRFEAERPLLGQWYSLEQAVYGTYRLSKKKKHLPGHSPSAKLGRTPCFVSSLRPSGSVLTSLSSPPPYFSANSCLTVS